MTRGKYITMHACDIYIYREIAYVMKENHKTKSNCDVYVRRLSTFWIMAVNNSLPTLKKKVDLESRSDSSLAISIDF